MDNLEKWGYTLLGILVLAAAQPQRAARASGSLYVNSALDNNAADSVLTLREAILVANGGLTGGLTDDEKAQLGGCTFTGSAGSWTISGGCGNNIEDAIYFEDDYTIVLNTALPAVSDDDTDIVALATQGGLG